jgi:hypothetical protein
MSDWGCADCGDDTRKEYYMVHEYLWAQHGAEPVLCIGCLEVRMGRELWSGDFTHWPINNINMFEKSDRLIERLEREVPWREGTEVAPQAA